MQVVDKDKELEAALRGFQKKDPREFKRIGDFYMNFVADSPDGTSMHSHQLVRAAPATIDWAHSNHTRSTH